MRRIGKGQIVENLRKDIVIEDSSALEGFVKPNALIDGYCRVPSSDQYSIIYPEGCKHLYQVVQRAVHLPFLAIQRLVQP